MILSINNVSKNYGSETILKDINLQAEAGSRIGLIGINGSGKTTLLRIIASEEEPDEGSVYINDRNSVGYLSQSLGLDGNRTVYEETLEAFSELADEEEALERLRERIDGEKSLQVLEKLNNEYHRRLEEFEENKGFYFRSYTKSALRGLGFSEEDLDTPVSYLSGGQKMRAALAKLLLGNSDLILLDEPTNYLDLSSIAWLEGFLSSYSRAFIVVSHDRYFLDKTVTAVWEAENSDVRSFSGNYSSYQKQKELQLLSQTRAYENAVSEVKRQKEIIARLKSYNREKTVRRAESREKLLEKMKVPEKPSVNKVSNFRFEAAGIITQRALELKDLSVGYEGRALVEGINIQIKTGEKIGICGDNASGKSTLFRTIAGLISPLCGKAELGNGVKIAYFKQEHEDLNSENTILEELSEYSGKDNEEIRNLLGSLLFAKDDVFKKIGVLSGGERSRVEAAKLMLTKANLLLLDEPTNHLDFETKEMFERVIREFSGTVLVISHDRYLLDTAADRMIFFEDSRAYVYDSPYGKALEEHAARTADIIPEEPGDAGELSDSQDSSVRETLSKNKRKQLEKRTEDIEAEIQMLQMRISELENEFSSADFYKDQQSAELKTAQHKESIEKIALLEAEWVNCFDILENSIQPPAQ